MDPKKVRQRSKAEAALSPKLLCFSRLYDYSSGKDVGILELQVDLNSLLSSVSFLAGSETLTIESGGGYYAVNFTGGASVKLNSQRQSKHATQSAGMAMVTAELQRPGLTFIYHYQQDGTTNAVMVSSLLTTILLLILPALLFLLYVYRFTGRLVRFSAHIKNTRSASLTEYFGYASRDEFGVVVSEYNRMTQTITSLIRSVRSAEKQKNEANFYALQSQVNPHFLFNTLENIRIHAEKRKYPDVENMLFALSRFMRYNISLKHTSTLLGELEHIRHYLMIYCFRYQNRVSYTVNVPDGFEDVECPFCILQPIVENCFKHGMNRGIEEISVAISVIAEEADVVVEIRDDGAGMEPDRLKAVNDSLAAGVLCEPSREFGNVGLQNVNGRIRYFYGGQYGISFAMNNPRGLVCRIALGRKARMDSLTDGCGPEGSEGKRAYEDIGG